MPSIPNPTLPSGWCATSGPPPPSGLSAAAPRLASRGLASISPSRSRPALPPSGASRSTPPDPPWCISPRMLCPASATVSPTCAATAASIWHASTCRSSLPTGYASIPNATNSLSTRPCNGSIRPALLLLDSLVRLHSLDENSASDISSLLAFLRAINRRYHLALILVHHMAKRSSRNLGQSLRGSSDLHAWTDSACYLVRRPDDRLQLNLPSSTAPLPLPTPCCCASQAAGTSPSRCSSTARTPRRPRSPRRSAPLSAAPASRSPGPSCANACASTTLVSVSPSYLSNNAASPSAAPTAGTCRHDPHPRLPARSHPAAVPLFHRSAPGTRSERNDHRHTPRHLSCNQPRPGARNATAVKAMYGVR